MKRCPVSGNDQSKKLGYRRDSNGQPVIGEPEKLCLNHRGYEGSLGRIVTAEERQAY